MPPDARVEHAQTDSGIYRGRIIVDTEKNLIQQITSHTAVIHRKELLNIIPAIGENVRVAYSNHNARVLPVKERSKTQELGRSASALFQIHYYREQRNSYYYSRYLLYYKQCCSHGKGRHLY
jgi:hypothetical protein